MSASSDKKVQEPVSQAAPEPVNNADLALAILSLAEAIKSGKSDTSALAGQLAGIEKFLLDQEGQRPHENLYPPMKSDMNPEGDRDHPRSELKCKMYWVGYKMTKDNLRTSEIALLNRVQPGDYRVTKGDGKNIPFTVLARQDAAGKLERLNFHFPCKDADDRASHLSMESYLREVLGEVASTESLRAQIEQLKQQLSTYRSQGA